MKKLFLTFILAGVAAAAWAQDAPTGEGAAPAPAKPAFKFYGFFRSYLAVDSRESKSGLSDLYYYVPLDRNVEEATGEDLNAHWTARYTAITSRLGVDVLGVKIGQTNVSGRFEADFYAGLANVTGTAYLRLRQAFITLGWESGSLKIGQAWHPMAADLPDINDLESGAPFGPFNRSPQLAFDWKVGNWTLTASALWQMQYTSSGPEGAVANYIKYACTPEVYLGAAFKAGDFLAKGGVDILSIKPRFQGNKTLAGGQNVTAKVSDRITTASPFVYLQYKKDLFSVKAKSILGFSGEHMNLPGGYGVAARHGAEGEDGSWEYTPMMTSSSWLSLAYGKKIQGVFFAGFSRKLGTVKPLSSDLTLDGVDYSRAGSQYLSKSVADRINALWRVEPGVNFNWSKLTVGLSCQVTSARYAEYLKDAGVNYLPSGNGVAYLDQHWVTNVRILGMVKYSF